MKQNSSSIKHNSVDNNNNNNRFPIDDYSEDNTDTNNELVISITKIEKVQTVYSNIDSSTVFGNTECNAEITNKKELNDRDIVFDSNLKSRKIKYNYKELVGITSIYHLVCWQNMSHQKCLITMTKMLKMSFHMTTLKLYPQFVHIINL